MLTSLVAELLDAANAGPPPAKALIALLSPRATAITHGNENLTYPSWAKGTRGSGDTYLTFAGDIAGIALYDDSRGWGAYAEIAVAQGTRAELEALLGTMRDVPPNPGGRSPPTISAYVERGGKTVRVFVELDRADRTRVRRVTLHFQT
jgi:hypothetical protein